MQPQNRLLDDLAKLATGALGTLRDARGEVEERLREQFERILSRMDFVSREEFEAVKEMAAKTREENEALAARIAKLEPAGPSKARSGGQAKRKTTRKTTAQKTSSRAKTKGRTRTTS